MEENIDNSETTYGNIQKIQKHMKIYENIQKHIVHIEKMETQKNTYIYIYIYI